MHQACEMNYVAEKKVKIFHIKWTEFYLVYGHSLIIGQDEKGTKSMKSYAYLINVIHQFLFVMLLECMSFRFCFISFFGQWSSSCEWVFFFRTRRGHWNYNFLIFYFMPKICLKVIWPHHLLIRWNSDQSNERPHLSK